MAVEPDESFGSQLRRLRLAAGLSQEDLAERAGLTTAAIGALERGERRQPYPHTLQALADALGLSATDRAAFFTSVPRRGSNGAKKVGDEGPVEPARGLPPAALTPIVGRERDVAIVTGLLRRGGARLVTLTGPGGVGKTRVALEVVAPLRDSSVISLVWVDLAPVRDPELVVVTIGHALGLAERAGQDSLEMLASYLGRRQTLIVLDNFEHLLAAAPAMSSLLQRCPTLTMLVTSREALRIRGEHEVQVLPLSLPGKHEAHSVRSVARSEAAALFLQCARSVRPAFELTDAEAPDVAAICTRLDGIPLALELAAAQLRYMSPAALLQRLESRLSPLERELRDLPDRQQSLRATVAWSYGLLTAPEQELFRRGSIFVGGFTREAAQAVCDVAGSSLDEMGRTLTALVDKSVVQAVPDTTGEVRFTMLETIGEYAQERLVESGEESKLAARHAEFFCGLAEAVAPHLNGASREVWLRRLDVEMANLQLALAWAAGRDDPRVGLRLAGALAWFWIMRGYIREGTHWTNLFLARPGVSSGAAEWAAATYSAAAMAWKRGDHEAASRHAEESVATWRTLGDKRGLAFSLVIAGHAATSRGDLEQAMRYHEESLLLFRERRDGWGIAYALSNLGDVLLEKGDLAAAERNYVEALTHFSAVEDPWGRGIVLHTLGNLSWAKGEVAAARERYRASVAHFRTIGNRENIARGLIGLAAATLSEGNADQSRQLLTESLAIWRDFGSPAGIALCLAGLAAVEVARGRHREAVCLFGGAEVQQQAHVPLYLVDADVFSHYLRIAREHLDEALADQAWREGQAMSPEQAVEYALQLQDGAED